LLAEALKARTMGNVLYACGSAENIPLPENTVDLVFMSMVFHHFIDPLHAALECQRVLRRHGRVFLRTASAEQIFSYPYVPFFPTSVPLLEQRLPSLTSQCTVFQNAGFETLFRGMVTQQIAEGYSEYAEKISARADSILISLNDDDFNAGLKSLRAQAGQPMDAPVTEPIDVVVFGNRLS
jgi:ubiquinone/menaquinone biosynthesis C-methylase UbiE